MSKMYIKAIVKEVITNPNLLVKLEGVEGFILKSKDYKEETELVKKELKDKENSTNNFEPKDVNIFITYDENGNTFELRDVDTEFNVNRIIDDIIKNINFSSQNPYIFGVEVTNNEITSIRKCD
ncbi:hypothetical protein [Clostridium tyrobutyricum]|uniref:hypothetical protein n=1 Tax=Clostridium tyrobutyricum TaxID=1519 RepID=UPI000306A811|nr:hypothetical protein [Clostridium tyrobutyricum]